VNAANGATRKSGVCASRKACEEIELCQKRHNGAGIGDLSSPRADNKNMRIDL